MCSQKNNPWGALTLVITQLSRFPRTDCHTPANALGCPCKCLFGGGDAWSLTRRALGHPRTGNPSLGLNSARRCRRRRTAAAKCESDRQE